MKKTLIVVALSLFIFSCEKSDNVVPVKEVNILTAGSYFDTVSNAMITPTNARLDLCMVKNEVIKYFCYGHTWKFKYYLGDSDSLFIIPGLIDASLGANTAVWHPNGTVTEYTYENVQFNSGSLIIDSCGTGFHVNTLFLQNQWFVFDEFKLSLFGNHVVKVTFKGKVSGVRVEAVRD